MFGPGATELIIVLLVVLLLFGGTQLPKLARSLGQAQREFNKGNEHACRARGHHVTRSPHASDWGRRHRPRGIATGG
jgi:sec-independent protein translocase protein TatA